MIGRPSLVELQSCIPEGNVNTSDVLTVAVPASAERLSTYAAGFRAPGIPPEAMARKVRGEIMTDSIRIQNQPTATYQDRRIAHTRAT